MRRAGKAFVHALPFIIFCTLVNTQPNRPSISVSLITEFFRLHDITGQGIGGPSLGGVTASKLEYADDIGLLDCPTAEASERVAALARGSRTPASMEMSAPKSKGMKVNIRERLSVSTEVEVVAQMQDDVADDTRIGGHRARWCRPGQRPVSRRGQLVHKVAILVKRKAICCFASTSGHGRRVARVGLLVRLPRVPLHQRRRRRS